MMEQRPEALFDSLILAAVALEIQSLARARFAGASQVDSQTLVLRLAAGPTRHSLLCCIHPRTARVHFAAQAPATAQLGPFGLLLRSRLADARLVAVDQPPFNRLLRLGFDALQGRLWFIVEVMGRHSNLILADERVVLGALKVVTPQMSPRRPVLAGRPYAPPPAARPTPEMLDLDALRRLLDSPLALDRRLSQTLLGVSPPMAREVAMRAGLDPAAAASGAVAAAAAIRASFAEIAALARRATPAPTVYLQGTRVVAYAPFPMQLYAHFSSEPAATMSAAIDRYYRQGPATVPIEDRRRETSGLVKGALAKRESALEESRRVLAESAAAGRLRVMGDLILTHAHEITKGATTLRAQDYTAGGAEIQIPLDPARTPSDNAQQYFRRYAKARAGARALPERIARLEAEATALESALVQIDRAASDDDLWEIEADLASA
ncbi:MAG TPA: NFACT family protein, partial [Thermoanaerobaculia bacterium]|nr:NFACT family protein [Thermoanaerobaculia bacterium]